MFIEIDESPGCQQRIGQMAIVTINNLNVFTLLTSTIQGSQNTAET